MAALVAGKNENMDLFNHIPSLLARARYFDLKLCQSSIATDLCDRSYEP